ncbi:UDP-N-acetylmuramoyl-L-alanyl-D-glutamate--2,6-diaminopimelate ligase [Heliobacterium chlorum]|uniref:UDP-N-acetylmuramoyl-L-alanyl-D-glutamate--2,6-diaminopimelate ligase n=1 Tax=Heliobacterium chlorum TaxID=2698 RepID=A0ABR7SZT3_HELCL|nr:UDP-N-acetylmuramoyl-L-alanyl-D-glutamate--2,6-diaminopimelate ligase [Heliobacterium chlorum]MBC9783248.1 UDP-N-acetylmuramoyl-L-alanyl-D-glutamate--2,6-diaminopimelate ligase [Heliobacterium chlorum]
MELSKILANVEVREIRWTGETDDLQRLMQSKLEISGLAYDSRQVAPGFLFFCIPGQKTDGHNYAAQAVERGAAVLVVERFVDLKVPQIRVSSTRESLALAAGSFYGHPSEQLLMIGVTGTNGKTTTTYMIEAVLKAKGYSVGVIGTIGNQLGEKRWPAGHTTPESLDLQKLLAEMRADGADAVVMEVSSHSLDQHRVLGVNFDIAAFTNLTQDHLDYHQTLENYRAAKGKLFRELGQKETKKGILKRAVINADDPSADYFLQVSSVPSVTYGVEEDAAIQAKDWDVTPQGARCTVQYPGGTVDMTLQLTGRFNISNSLTAFTVGFIVGMEPEQIVEALQSLRGVPGRFENVDQGQPFSVIVDYAHTPDGLVNVLNTAEALAEGKIVTVFGCGGDRDRTKRPIMGGVVAEMSDIAVVTSDNPRTENPHQIIEDILPGVQAVPGIEYKVEPDRKQAIALALSMANPGDLVMIAGKGHENYQIVGKEVLPFDDREVARQVLRGMGYDRS